MDHGDEQRTAPRHRAVRPGRPATDGPVGCQPGRAGAERSRTRWPPAARTTPSMLPRRRACAEQHLGQRPTPRATPRCAVGGEAPGAVGCAARDADAVAGQRTHDQRRPRQPSAVDGGSPTHRRRRAALAVPRGQDVGRARGVTTAAPRLRLAATPASAFAGRPRAPTRRPPTVTVALGHGRGRVRRAAVGPALPRLPVDRRRSRPRRSGAVSTDLSRSRAAPVGLLDRRVACAGGDEADVPGRRRRRRCGRRVEVDRRGPPAAGQPPGHQRVRRAARACASVDDQSTTADGRWPWGAA